MTPSVFDDEPTEDDRALGVINNPTEQMVVWVDHVRAGGGSHEQVNTGLRDSFSRAAEKYCDNVPVEVLDALAAATRRNAEHTIKEARGKPDDFNIFSVRIFPATDADAIANEIGSKFADDAQPFHVLHVWLDNGVVGALVRYRARGSNSNDVRRRIVGACPVASHQVRVVEIMGVNLDADMHELVAAHREVEAWLYR